MRPKIRLKGFSKEWENTSFKEIVKVNSGKDYKHLTEGDIPVYGTGGYMLSVNDSLSDKDGIGIGRKGTIDKPQLLKAPFWTVDTLFFMVPNENIDLNFLFAVSERTPWKKYDESTGVPSLSKQNIENISLAIPDKIEQQRIAEYFKNLDSLIEATTKKIETLKQTKLACLQSMFPQQGELKPCVRFKGFDGEWTKTQIGSLGCTYSGLTGKSKKDFNTGSAHYITFLNVLTNAHIDITAFETVDVKAGEKQNPVQKGDILFNTSSETPEEVGLCSVLTEDINDLYLNSFCFGFRPHPYAINPEFMVYLIRSHVGRSIMKILAQGATRYNLSKKRLCEASILIPTSQEEQHLIASFFSNFDKQISLYEHRLEKLTNIKSACLDGMFI